MDIIQGFNSDPDAKTSIQLVNGDGGGPCTNREGKQLFAGPTNKDIFLQRLRVGTFDQTEMKNHGFLAVITAEQLAGTNAKKWLAILKEQGFEFIRAVDNSVYSYLKPCYLFALFRNVKDRGLDPSQPPPEWDALPENTKTQKELFEALPPAKFLTEEEVRAAGAPVIEAGTRGLQPKSRAAKKEAKPSPWEAAAKAAPAQPQWTTMNTDNTKKVPA